MRLLAEHADDGVDGFHYHTYTIVDEGEVQLHEYRHHVATGGDQKLQPVSPWGELMWVECREGEAFDDQPATRALGRCRVDVGHDRPGALPAPTHPNGG